MTGMFFPDDVVNAAVATLASLNGNGVNTGQISELDIEDNDQLVFDPPCVRIRYAGAKYQDNCDNQGLLYNDVRHYLDYWCAAENLTGKTEQANDTLTLIRQVLPLVVGSRLALPNGESSEPLRITDITSLPDDPAGTVFVLSVMVPGIALFTGEQ